MSDKPKFPRAVAIEVARELCQALDGACIRLVVAGSLRRRKAEVGDVELLYIPRFEEVRDGLFDTKEQNCVDVKLDELLRRSVLAKRENSLGIETWGEKNKLAIHPRSGIPVDLFSANLLNWWNYLVCRTGSAENNIRISTAAQARGYQWHPYSSGFTHTERTALVTTYSERDVTSERDVFEIAGLPYLEPWQR